MQIDELIERLACDCDADVCTFQDAAKALRDLKASADALAGVLERINNECGQCGGYGTYPAEETVTGKILWWDCSDPACAIATQALAAYREKFND